MTLSTSGVRAALRRAGPDLVSANLLWLAEALRARRIVTLQDVEAVRAERRPPERWRILETALQSRPAAFDDVKRALRAQGRADLAQRLSDLYEEALSAPPDVSAQSYLTKLQLAGVPGLPPCLLSRPEKARRVRDALMTTTDAARIVLLHGMPGTGKTTLLTEAIRNHEVIDHFTDGLFWFNVGRNVEVKEKIQLIKSFLIKDSRRALLLLDDVWERDFVSAVAAAFPSACLAVSSRDPAILGAARSACAVDVKLPDAWSLEDCRSLFAKWLDLSPEAFPVVTIDAICLACSQWPLAVCMVAQVVYCEVSAGGDLLACLDDYLSKVQRNELHAIRTFFDYGFEPKFAGHDDEFDLSLPVRLTLDRMTPVELERLLALAILDPDVSVTKEALVAIWAHLLENTGGADVVSLLPGSLVSQRKNGGEAGGQWQFCLHAVVRDAVLGSLDEAALLRSHAQLVQNYELLSGERQWGRLPEDGYIVTQLCRHLEVAGRGPEIPDAFSDFLFTSRLFAACGWAGTLQVLRRFAAFFASPEQRAFHEGLAEALEEAAAAGINPRYAVPLIQSLLLLPVSHPMFLWADRARQQPEVAAQLDQHLWRPAVRTKSPFRACASSQAPSKFRGAVTTEGSHGVIVCVAVSSSKRHIAAIRKDNSLIICDAGSLTCTSSGMQLELKGYVQQAAFVNCDRTLLLLLEDLQLLFAHLRCGVGQLPRDCSVDGKPEAIHATPLLPGRQLQRFVTAGRRVAAMDRGFAVEVFDLTFHPRNNAPNMSEVCSIAEKESVDCFLVRKDAALKMRDLSTRLLAMKKTPPSRETFNQFFQSITAEISPLIENFSKYTSNRKVLMIKSFYDSFSSLFFLVNFTFLMVLIQYSPYTIMELMTLKKLMAEMKDLLTPLSGAIFEMSRCGTFLALVGWKDRQTVKLFNVEVVAFDRTARILRLPSTVISLRFLDGPNFPSTHIAIAYSQFIGVWSVQKGTVSMKMHHLFDVTSFAADADLELCAAIEWPALTTWHLSLTSKSEHLQSEVDKQLYVRQCGIAQRPLLIDKLHLGHLLTLSLPPIGRVLLFDEFRAPSLVTVSGRTLLVANVADEALVILDPWTRSVLLSDPSNKMKNRVVTSSSAGIVVGGENAALCEYRYAKNGRFANAKPHSLGPRWAGVAVTALEYTPRGSLVVGLQNGAILIRSREEQTFRCVLEPSGKFVVFFAALPKRRGFFSWSADAKSVEMRVWSETKKKVQVCKFSGEEFDNADFFNFFMTRDGIMRELFRPKVSRDETFVAMMTQRSMVFYRRIIICNVTGTYHRIDMFVTKPSFVSNILFHPGNDRVLFFSALCGIYCYQIDDPTFDRRSWPLAIPRLDLNLENVSSLSAFDAHHVIVCSWQSVTLWQLSRCGELSKGRLILPRSKFPGNLELTFSSEQGLLCVTTCMEKSMLGIYSLERTPDLC